MLPYILLAVTPLLLRVTILEINFAKPDTRKKIFIILFGLALFFMIAFRSKYIGSEDSYGYYQNWLDYSRMSWQGIQNYAKNSPMELGYIYTTWFLSQFIENAQHIFIFSGALFSIAVCRFIYKNSEDITLSATMFVTLGLYVFMVQGLRQGVAMSILLFAVEFVKKRKLIPFVLLVILASLFHQSAIVFLFVYLLYGRKLNALSVLILSIVSAFLLAISSKLVEWGNQFFERDYSYKIESGGFIAVSIYAIILLTAFLFARSKINDKHFAFFIYLTVFGSVFYLMRYFDALIIERISFYFMFGQLVVLPSVINCLNNRDKQLAKIFVYVLSILLFAYRLNGSDLVPFEFYWQ